MKLSRVPPAAALALALSMGAVALPVSAGLTVIEKNAAPAPLPPPVQVVEEGTRLREDSARDIAEIARLRADLARVQSELDASRAGAAARAGALGGVTRALDDIERRIEQTGNALVRVTFAFGSVRFEPPAALAGALLSAGNKAGAVRIAGHTDNAGTAAANERVAMRRALSARQYLIERGVDRDKISVVARGADEPLLDNLSADGRAQNRRVEIDFRR